MALKKRVRLKKKVKIFLLYVFLFTTLSISLLNIFLWGKDNKENNDVKKNIIKEVKMEVKDDEEETYIETDLRKLKEMNSDTVAWVYVPNTGINYPVLQTNDNDYYLNRSFYKQKNEAGWIFLDYRNSPEATDKNTIVYGHNRLDGSMFGTLKRALNENWLRNNQYVYYNTLDTNNTYIIFSAYSINAEQFQTSTTFYSTKSYQSYLNTIKSRSILDLGIDVTTDDKIITLYTCAYNNIDRTIVHAKLIQSIRAS